MRVTTEMLSKLILKDLFNDKHPEIDIIKGIIIEGLNTTSVEFILHCLTEPGFKTLNKSSYFKVLYNEEYCKTGTLIDNLSDIGLYDDGYVYGRILSSDDYGSEFRKHHPRMQVELYLHDSKDKEMEPYNTTINTWLLKKIDKSEIKYFNHGVDK
jgi:hypothetical protein